MGLAQELLRITPAKKMKVSSIPDSLTCPNENFISFCRAAPCTIPLVRNRDPDIKFSVCPGCWGLGSEIHCDSRCKIQQATADQETNKLLSSSREQNKLI